ncbi:hypothetical protein [Providencia sp. PROV140]|uniref:hypothetical protein n=1 Tax=Providencia sp. PROV140 TaxID=2949850 RepID=UPI00234B316A|nr:hypothetical protein [Providencia sp. PROV140]
MDLKEDIIAIKSEDEVFRYLEKYSEGEAIPSNIKLDGWPNLTFRLTGEKFQGSITPSVMKGFVEMQQQVNRAYASLRYNDPDKRLSKEERESIEIVIIVAAGSSIINVDFDGLLEYIGKELIDKMTPQEIIITILGTAVIWGGVTVFKKHLDNRREIRAQEVKKESEKQFLDTMKIMSEEETKRLEILEKVMTSNPRLQRQQEFAEDARTDVLKSLTNAKTVEIDDLVLDQELTKQLSASTRKKTIETRIDGIYKVEKVDSSDPNVFKVTVRDTETDKLVTCIVQDVFLDEKENKKILQQAEWNRKPLKLSINARVRDGEIRSATIVYVNYADS